MRNIFGQTIELTAFQLTRHPTLRLRQQRKVSSLGTDTIFENPLELPQSPASRTLSVRPLKGRERLTAPFGISQSFFIIQEHSLRRILQLRISHMVRFLFVSTCHSKLRTFEFSRESYIFISSEFTSWKKIFHSYSICSNSCSSAL